MILILDGDDASHVALAITHYMPWAKDQGLRPSPRLLEAAEAIIEARRGQVGTNPSPAPARVDTAPMPTERLLATENQTAELLSCSTRTVRRMAADGRLDPVRLGGVTRYRRSDIDAIAGGA